ncbi:MAG: biotin--[acetyl-CoA-carboxylase] ligase [Leptotrichiaceae bacterium]|jgi:BirA family biotin operon repressor/biotin-[acetyl-CoA-carboxylase] ligase|nr:biotin--[acetyl-CoA-carboxylase] ligase [Leptotrichiaceae bacterium]MBP6168043.1 biotin--[acetyl-CoA-carboxylase] ligase [Leptotrichiaceae bacterium]MBP7026806.1 biotin--[acetyl-CoA-carboxylase] ligase [Leptotrichiaceae bacterium]MBP8637206.1 biotin--[acetyl-CoA-carboxylase] ligase [Leptotrichiaceae bacterium]MBP9538993.1 biotin--[acetyl-CoA-carboxylase] ligase [Leptotrichiaceae bacterium]
MEIKTFDVLDSTNEYLKNKEKLEEYEVVIAKTQTNGRGKRGSVWISNEGAALFSFVIDSIGYDDKVTIYTGFIVRNILHKLIKEAFSENVESYLKFKWPNDIYYKDKKLCGILCEKVGEKIIVGIGINVNNNDFGIFNERATSLNIVTGEKYEIEKLVKEVVIEFKEHYRNLNSKWNSIIEDINENSYLVGKKIMLKQNKEYRKFIEIDIDGNIVTLSQEGKTYKENSLEFEIL